MSLTPHFLKEKPPRTNLGSWEFITANPKENGAVLLAYA